MPAYPCIDRRSPTLSSHLCKTWGRPTTAVSDQPCGERLPLTAPFSNGEDVSTYDTTTVWGTRVA